jgi:hypothetical protein
MRWLPAFLLAACSSTWTSYEMSEEARPVLVRALRAAEGNAIVVADDRAYRIRHDALRDELRAFRSAVADAVESRPFSFPAQSPPDAAADAAVVAMSCVSRSLEMGGVEVESMRTDSGFHYRVTTLERPGRYVYATFRGTAEADEAWERLAGAARAEAPTWRAIWFAPTPPRWVRDVWVDWGGLVADRPAAR